VIITSTDVAISRVLGIDVGARRVGLAISDPSRTLARPLRVIEVNGIEGAVDLVAGVVADLAMDPDGLAQIVVGLPRRLDGAASDATAHVTAFIERLRQRTAVPITTEDERLSSREAERRLATRERDWRKRKAMLDAAAAAVILQDYLDRSR
jgi:putative Holliday junction resolvase